MADRLQSTIGRLLRIPPPPRPPDGSAESTHVFRAARGFYVRRLLEWGLAQLGAGAGITFGFGFAAADFMPDRVAQLIGGYIRLGESLAVGLFVAQFLASFLILRLDYRLRWYIVTDRSLRIREGILRVREQTVSFANIQNVAVRQGPLQRLLGIADLEIRTAGGGEAGDKSAPSDNLHRAVFRGVDNALEIRDLIRADLRRLRDAGRAERSPPAQHTERPLLDACRALADAAGELRTTLESASRRA